MRPLKSISGDTCFLEEGSRGDRSPILEFNLISVYQLIIMARWFNNLWFRVISFCLLVCLVLAGLSLLVCLSNNQCAKYLHHCEVYNTTEELVPITAGPNSEPGSVISDVDAVIQSDEPHPTLNMSLVLKEKDNVELGSLDCARNPSNIKCQPAVNSTDTAQNSGPSGTSSSNKLDDVDCFKRFLPSQAKICCIPSPPSDYCKQEMKKNSDYSKGRRF